MTQVDPRDIGEKLEDIREVSRARRNGLWRHRERARNGRECIGRDEEVTHDYACLFYVFYMFYIV